jgi:phage N-6-adenine-methyltransferase
MGKPSDSWSTPKEVFDWCNERFGPFNLDVCANHDNYKVFQYFTEETNGLIQDWGAHTEESESTGFYKYPFTCWMNPPYSDPNPWIRKARDEAKKGSTVVCLLKLDPTTKIWKECIQEAYNANPYPGVEVIYWPKRIKFVAPPGLISKKTGKLVKSCTAAFPSVIIVFRPVL